MFVFIRLILAHLIGDFLFQFDFVYAMKVKGPKGLAVHVAIVMFWIFLICLPYLDQPVIWYYLAFIGATHYLQDWAKIRFTSRSKYQLFFYCLDQVVHALLISAVLLTSIKNNGPLANPQDNLFIGLYNNDIVILYFIMAIIASYAGHYLIILYKLDYMNRSDQYTNFEKWYGFMERILVVSGFFLGGYWILLAAGVFIVRPAFGSLKIVSVHFASLEEIVLSGAFSIAVGLIFYTLI